MEDNDENEFVSLQHDQLINAITKLDKTQYIKDPTRNEPTNLNSEFNLLKRSNRLDLSKVVNILDDTAHHIQIGKKLKKSQDGSKILPKPLEKPQAERVKRATGYEQTKKKIGRWDPVVARNRTVDFVAFPIKRVSTKLEPTNEFISKFTLKSQLEKELDIVDPPIVVDEEIEDKQVYPMSYEEMVEQRQHLAKIRAQQSYKAAKAKRQSKIKSKKYHRILKKEKLKQQLKEFEDLQRKNPEEALRKLEALEKARALERHTLRHKNTGKWAKSKLIRAKYDKETRQQLAEQLSVGRSLTHKTQDAESTDDEADDNNLISDMTLSQDPSNPWMKTRSDKSNVDTEFDFGYKKYIQGRKVNQIDNSDCEFDQDNKNKSDLGIIKGYNEINKYIVNPPQKNKSNNENNEGVDVSKIDQVKLLMKLKANSKLVATTLWEVESISDITDIEKRSCTASQVVTAFNTFESEISDKVELKLKKIRKELQKLDKQSPQRKMEHKDKKEINNLEYLKLKNQKVKAIIDEELIETHKNIVDDVQNNDKPNQILNRVQSLAQDNNNTNIDPSRFIEVKPKYLNSAVPQGDKEYDLLEDDEQVVPKVNIEAVFEEDDVVASFRQEKQDEINKDKLEDIDLSLPGWGSWGGKGVKIQKRKRNRFILKAPPQNARRDENKGDIIIKEFKDPKLATHKVCEVPFPFTSVKEFEASIRAPLGNTFIPEKAHKRLIRPNIITKAGAIIEPMDEEELLVRKHRKFKNEAVIKLLGQK